jgi:hypothetical protein
MNDLSDHKIMSYANKIENHIVNSHRIRICTYIR